MGCCSRTFSNLVTITELLVRIPMFEGLCLTPHSDLLPRSIRKMEDKRRKTGKRFLGRGHCAIDLLHRIELRGAGNFDSVSYCGIHVD